jgi:hypothetical protein
MARGAGDDRRSGAKTSVSLVLRAGKAQNLLSNLFVEVAQPLICMTLPTTRTTRAKVVKRKPKPSPSLRLSARFFGVWGGRQGLETSRRYAGGV